jgi:hypothetical protein
MHGPRPRSEGYPAISVRGARQSLGKPIAVPSWNNRVVSKSNPTAYRKAGVCWRAAANRKAATRRVYYYHNTLRKRVLVVVKLTPKDFTAVPSLRSNVIVTTQRRGRLSKHNDDGKTPRPCASPDARGRRSNPSLNAGPTQRLLLGEAHMSATVRDV